VIDIVICSREEAGAILCSSSERKNVVLLVSIGESHDPAPAGFRNVSPRLRFLFPDTNGEAGATVDDIRRLIDTAQAFADKSGRVVIHCQAGISRSTAAATSTPSSSAKGARTKRSRASSPRDSSPFRTAG